MGKTRIFFAYKHTDKPWGGANNFIRALYDGIANNPDFIVHHDIKSHSDIIFFSQLSCGPGNVASGSEKVYNFSDINALKNKSKAKLIVRAVNLNINSNKPKGLVSLFFYVKDGLISDINTIRLVNLADFVIFQSEFQKSFFKKWGYIGEKNAVIHNGAPEIFKNNDIFSKEAHLPLRLVSNSNYKTFKKHELVAKMSLLGGVSVIHVGNWFNKIKRNKVDVRGTLTHAEIADIYRESDYLLHPAILDPCPNSIIEAMLFGLPVIYSDGEGSSQELVRGNGIPINEKDLEKTIQLAIDGVVFLKQKLASERNYYSIERAVSGYVEVFNNFKK